MDHEISIYRIYSTKKWWVYYPVVRRELKSYGCSISPLNEERRSYQEFPNHILVYHIFVAGHHAISMPTCSKLSHAMGSALFTKLGVESPRSIGGGEKN